VRNSKRSRNDKLPPKEYQRGTTNPNADSNREAPTIYSSTSSLAAPDHSRAAEDKEQVGKKFSVRLKDPNTYIALGTILLVFIGLGALAVTRDTEINQLSAFVTVNDLRRDDVLDKSGAIVNSHFIPIVENSGQTAIMNGTYQLGFGFWRGKDNLSAPETPTAEMVWLPASRISIGPRSKLDAILSNVATDGGIIEELRNKTTALYVAGNISYSDVFGYCHLTRVRTH
jgi:hypothetical protein